MTHLELENLASDYLEGQLDLVRKVQFEAHLAECGQCRELIADMRRVMELCQAAEELEPAPWLVSKILLATVGERKPTLRERFSAYLRPVLQPRVAYVVAMAVFSFSIIINAAGINLRNVKAEALNPRHWLYEFNRNGHLLLARAEKFYFDLRVVIEIESRFGRAGAQGSQSEKEAPKQAPPGGGTTKSRPLPNSELADNMSHTLAASGALLPVAYRNDPGPAVGGAGRSPSR